MKQSWIKSLNGVLFGVYCNYIIFDYPKKVLQDLPLISLHTTPASSMKIMKNGTSLIKK
jgi:hypothetical protein